MREVGFRRSWVARSYRSEGPGPGATLHRPCVSLSSYTGSPWSSGWCSIWHFPDPAYPDSFYYVDVARALAAGQGFSIDVVWIFPEVGGAIPPHPTLPIPSNAHWMPLASLVQVPFLAVLGPTAWASALPFALIGSVAAPMTWAIARDAGARARSP